MATEQSNLEDIFQNIQPGDGLPGDFNPNENAAEFDAFFEKLSSLEDLTWNESKPPVEDDLPPTRQSEPPVFHGNGKNYPGRNRMSREASSIVRSKRTDTFLSQTTKTFGKFFLMASILFSVGMGVGWLALSLPDRFDKDAQVSSPFLEETTADTAIENMADGKAIPSKSESKTIVFNQAKTEKDLTSAATKQPASPTKSQANETPEKSIGSKIAAETQASVAKITTTPAPAEPALLAGGNFSLQVGACFSENCVARYRTLLEKHVAVDRIQVIQKTAEDTGKTILRVRIAPLQKSDAANLKTRLAGIDNRFKDAYVVNIN